MTFEEFRDFEILESQSDDPNQNNLIAAAKVADVHITNNGSLEELHTQIEEVLTKLA